MKIRNGFVSNSSSSSFVVAFPEVPKDEYELRRMLFGRKKSIDVFDYPVSCDEMALIIFNDIDGFDEVTEEEIAEELNCGQFSKKQDEYYNQLGDSNFDAYRSKCKKLAQEVSKDFCRRNHGKHLFLFEYSDNNGIVFSTMEHGNIFEKLPHLVVCKH